MSETSVPVAIPVDGAEAAAPTLATFTLENILGENHENIESSHAEGWDEETVEKPVLEGFCIECEGA